MSVQPNEPGQQPDNTEGQAPDSGHPAWQDILDAIPESLHPLVTPKLQEWDRGVNDKLSQVRSQYDPYKTFVDNKIDPTLLQQAIGLVNAIENDPASVAKDLIDEFGLDYVEKAVASQQQQPDQSDPDDFFGEVDITKHPAFVQVQQALEQVTNKITAEEETKQQEKARKDFEQSLEGLKKDPVTGQDREFDPLFVTALMSQGASGEEAVKQYQTIVNQAAAKIAPASQQQDPPAPVVMGGAGTTGSGLPDGAIKMGDLKRNDVNQMVAEIIAKAQASET